ncbi:hypothetical protein V6N11_038030 [Hibiscus sabdariffa]|uniref:Uncharacterized protein n=2 Tax=Hibiscus sabdariffa TaxID=183260 RepID=A0ABR2CJ13_9ROSI
MFRSVPLLVLAQPAVPQSTQCRPGSSFPVLPAPVPVSNTGTDASVHVEEQPPLADDVALLPVQEQLSLASTESVTPVMHSSSALNYEAENVGLLVTPMSGGPALVASTDQQAAAESSKQPGDYVAESSEQLGEFGKVFTPI